ncbi:SEC-C domain-containing protein [Bradyrhizobium sp. 24]|nr:SEC-C domain-containing protein [Bradyrhizobium sp. 37]MCK1381883.1 SEC-C domain-containing protein [Bradyrhizobium sp. 24]MCK1768198.1 SEC-C domain-containing protein [Bradyrhizobium sp. 134]
MENRNRSVASSVVCPCGSGKKTETCFCWRR